MVGILLDSKYSESLWCKSLHQSLVEALRKNRISFCELFDKIDGNTDAVFIIASDRKWTVSAITQLNQKGIKPILICNEAEKLTGCIYSCVCSDINASMKNLLDTLKAKGKTRIALYGINAESISDTARADSLFGWNNGSFEAMQVFNNNGSLQNCFNEFFGAADNFDAAICANDFAAVSLVRNLREKSPERLNSLYVISCAETKISSFYRDNVVSLNMNFEEYGRAAVYLYNALKKHTYLSEMTVKILWSLENDAPKTESGDLALNLTESEDAFYEDAELAEMLIVDKLLQNSDETELKIIDALLEGKTTEQIADDCFLTVGGVKYHIKKLINDCGAADKNQVVSLLKKYIR